ncbi:hypothetical protein U6G28_02140 [Actinomycetaceae bacterium MB13-C1-2]|nr:hypothetical protein U6G28_02140 [Actinomycetaceae bacterium MB13-C1-2]
MKTKKFVARIGAAALGTTLLAGTAGAAMAADATEDAEVEIGVDISAPAPTGALSMTVAANATTLTEITSADPAQREFRGTLPTVTVEDTRTFVEDGLYWYVTGQSSAFSAPGVGDVIEAGHLGWRPALVSDEETAEEDGVVVGDEVMTVMDTATQPGNNTGLVGEELLALSLDSAGSATGSWEANADLFLKTGATVAPGNYSATLTLSLWEDAY